MCKALLIISANTCVASTVYICGKSIKGFNCFAIKQLFVNQHVSGFTEIRRISLPLVILKFFFRQLQPTTKNLVDIYKKERHLVVEKLTALIFVTFMIYHARHGISRAC